MSRNGQGGGAGPDGGIARPLLWSAAGHVLALSACIVLGAARGPQARFLPVVEVLLVAGEPGPDAAGPGRNASPRPGAGDARPDRAVVGAPAPRSVRSAPETVSAPPAPVTTAAPAAAAKAPKSGPVSQPAPSALLARAEIAHAPPAGAEGARFPSPAAAPAPVARAGASTAAPAPGGAGSTTAIVSVPGGAGGGGGPGVAGAGSAALPGGGDAGGGRGGATVLLRERIQSRIHYPEEAVRRGLEGEVLLRIHIATGGVPNEILVAQSSGARLLDDAARRGVVSAAPLPSAPGWVDIPVRFRLQ